MATISTKAEDTWGLGASGTRYTQALWKRKQFFKQAGAALTNRTFPRLRAFNYFDVRLCKINEALTEPFEAFIGEDYFAVND